MDNQNKNTKEGKGIAKKRTFRLYDKEYEILEELEMTIGLSKSKIIRKLIRHADKILF